MRSMVLPPEWRCAADALGPGATAKFQLECDGRRIDAFIVQHGEGYHAYVNRCPHVGTPLDLWPNEFLTEDGRSLICATHGAIYEPGTGRCIAGPCIDDWLEALPVVREGDVIIVRCPATATVREKTSFRSGGASAAPPRRPPPR
jgi:naringenin degradation protein FdeD